MGLLVIAALLLTVGIFVIRGARQFVARSHWVEHTHDVLNALEHVYATVKDIEADQRGYLLTGRTELEQEFLSNLPAARAAAFTRSMAACTRACAICPGSPMLVE